MDMPTRYTYDQYARRLSENELYQRVWDEIESGQIDGAAQARAIEEGGGDNGAVKSAYIKHRIENFKAEIEIALELAARALAEEEERKKKEAERKKIEEQVRRKEKQEEERRRRIKLQDELLAKANEERRAAAIAASLAERERKQFLRNKRQVKNKVYLGLLKQRYEKYKDKVIFAFILSAPILMYYLFPNLRF